MGCIAYRDNIRICRNIVYYGSNNVSDKLASPVLHTEDGDRRFLKEVVASLQDHAVPYPRRSNLTKL
jgi:hypothetical protein